MAKNDNKAVKCYYCGKLIEESKDLVIKKVPLRMRNGKLRNYNRKLHIECLLKYVPQLENEQLHTEEHSDWMKVYEYMRSNILGYNQTVPLDNHTVMRLRGLRLGKYYPNGENVVILPRGFEYTTILIAMKVVNPRIQAYLNTANFVNQKHKIDGIMRFISGEILDVQKRIDIQKKANEKLDQEVSQPTFDYKSRLKQKKKEENKGIADDVASLLGGSL